MLEQLLVEHGAPTLAKLKVGNLMKATITDPADFERERLQLAHRLALRGVVLTVLKHEEGHALIYLYRPKALKEVLACPRIQAFLHREGYEKCTPGEAIATLRRHLQSQESFPHEIGIFLGYPLDDVTAFIDNSGQGCALCGCWKAYHNVCQAQKIFRQYEHCREVYTRLFRSGWSMEKLTVAA